MYPFPRLYSSLSRLVTCTPRDILYRVSHQQILQREHRVSSKLYCSGGSKDEELKSILREINKDFGEKGIVTEVKEILKESRIKSDNNKETDSSLTDKNIVQTALFDKENLSENSSSDNSGQTLSSITQEDKRNLQGLVSSGQEQEQEGSLKKKDLQDLLTELYGEDTAEGSSVDGYSEYRDEDARVIYDVDEERTLLREAYESGKDLVLDKDRKQKTKYKYDQISKSRGERGVFDLEDLVTVIKGEKVSDVACIRIPSEKQYADYLVIGTGRNPRHLFIASQLIKKLYKMKCSPKDTMAVMDGVEDKGASGWIAMDLGNIIVHLFTPESREKYDLETLWTVGSRFDTLTIQSNLTDSLSQLMSSHLEEFEPVEQDQENQEPSPKKQINFKQR
ncbi:uncharacterized protein LOC111701957 [Eurytemora carolleeae]|uniref:uncharacterized protein LOC111701957 n=1 Tax=Eurytemora carolleeae TaxID=1294199 RepID=UPI000C79077F|nr:uncharacterized protein LOC111701957 [Eurytemora carolleeae]|eukprot:XP_023329230.1 uncharacterized protein LOC111701957 [Eurytemora affinis]